jgi:uncharacterized membrane protein
VKETEMLFFAAPMFLGAFLLFLIQPVIAKAVLPWFGGSASIWTTCLMFFQITLLAGYAYAHGATRLLPAGQQATIHLILLLISLLALPILPGTNWKPANPLYPELRILALLCSTVGAPYFLLSSTSPLLQAWFAFRHPGVSPYRLFALSNTGSLLALLSYPIIMEPVLRLRF